MKALAPIASVLLLVSQAADAQQPNVAGRRLSPEDVRRVAPALEKYTQERLYGEVWKLQTCCSDDPLTLAPKRYVESCCTNLC